MVRSNRQHVKPEHAARLRAARAAEDAALALVSSRSDAVQRACVRRNQLLARQDANVSRVEAELAEAVESLVRAAGLDRAALALGVPRGAVRRMLPPAKPQTAARMAPDSNAEQPAASAASVER